MNLKRGLRLFILGGIFLLPFLAFVVTFNLYFPFVTGKGFVLRGVIECLAAAGAVLWFIDPASRPKKSPVLISYAVFIGALSLSTIFGINPFHSFWGNFERMEGLILHFHLFLLVLLIAMVFNDQKIWNRFFFFSVFASFFMAGVALLQNLKIITIYQPYLRVDGFVGHPSYLAAYTLLHIFFALFLLQKTKRRSLKAFLWLTIMLQLGSLYYTGTRSAQLGFIGAIVIAAIMNLKNHRRAASFTLCVFLIVSSSFFFLRKADFIQSNSILNRYANIHSETDKSGAARITLWKIAWKGFLDRPILGWGVENYKEIFSKHYDPEIYEVEPWFDRSHNLFLDWLSCSGICGLLSFLALCFWMIHSFFKSSLSVFEKSLFIALLGGLLIHLFFVFEDLTGYVYFFSLVGFAHFHARKKSLSVYPAQKPFIPVLISGIALYCCFYFFTFRPLFVCKNLRQAILQARHEPKRSLLLYQDALKYKTTGFYDVKEQLILSSMEGLKNSGISIETKQQMYQFAYNEALGSYFSGDYDLRLLFLAGLFFKEAGEKNLALNFLEKARSMCPNKQNILCHLALVHLLSNRVDEGISIAKKAYELAPKFDEATNTLAIAYLYAKQLDLAQKVLNDSFGTSVPADPLIAKVYANQGYLIPARIIFQKLVQLEPDNAQYAQCLAEIDKLLLKN